MSPQGRRSSYREGLTFSALSFAASGVLGIGSSIAIARAYGVHALGEYALAYAPVNIAWFLSTVKERPAFIRELAFLEPRAARVSGLFWAVFAFSFALTVVVGVVALAVAYFLYRGPIGHPELFLPAVGAMCGYVLLTNTAFNIDTVLSGFRAGRHLFHVRQHQLILFVVAGVPLGIWWGSVWGLIVATNVSWGVSLIHRMIVARGYMRARISREELRDGFRTLPDILRFALRVAPGGFADGASNSVGIWVLGVVSSVSAVGAFSRAWMLGRRFMELNWRISEMLFPTLVERRARDDGSGFDRALVDTMRYSAVGMLWPAAAGGGAAVGVMNLFGPGFTRVSDALILILLMPAASTISSLQRHALMAVDRPTATSVSAILRMVVTVAASIVLGAAIGPTGVALAVIGGYVADCTFMLIITRRHLTTPLHRLWRPRQLLALAAAYAAGFFAARVAYDTLGGVGGLLVALAAGTIAYGLTFLAIGGVDERDRARFAQVVSSLRKRRARPMQPAEVSS